MTNKTHTLGDGPIEDAYRDEMAAIGDFLDEQLNGPALPGLPSGKRKRQTGFVLLVFPFDSHEGRCNYISNADRRDIVVLLKEQLRRFEGQPDVKGRA